jgi:glycosyltransferase involved in cell wall biosynthesis
MEYGPHPNPLPKGEGTENNPLSPAASGRMEEGTKTMSLPMVSIIIPCRKEQGWIDKCLRSVIDNDYPKDKLEVLVVDGMSEDGTRAAVQAIAAAHPFIRLIDNPRKITPAALNIGIAEAKGDVIVRMDAHAEYPANYISALVRALEESGADNVGGIWITVPGGQSAMARAIAVGSSHPLGVGNAYYRIGASAPRWVDTVPFGCYRRDVFQRIGSFDEQLIRNQDDEFNHRLIKNGGRILLVPQVACRYYARDSLGKLARMFYQYGYFKPLAARKIGRVMTARQLGPALFILGLAFFGILAPWSIWMAAVFGIIICFYIAVISACGASIWPVHGPRCAFCALAVFPAIHFSYGLGYLKGILDFIVFRKVPNAANKTSSITR